MPDPATGTFRPLDDDARTLHGDAPALLVCGCTPPDGAALAQALAQAGLAALPLALLNAGDAARTLRDLAAGAGQHRTQADAPALPVRAVVAAGITQEMLHRAMAAYRASGLAPALWAALTPANAGWTLEALLRELQREHAALGAAMRRSRGAA